MVNRHNELELILNINDRASITDSCASSTRIACDDDDFRNVSYNNTFNIVDFMNEEDHVMNPLVGEPQPAVIVDVLANVGENVEESNIPLGNESVIARLMGNVDAGGDYILNPVADNAGVNQLYGDVARLGQDEGLRQIPDESNVHDRDFIPNQAQFNPVMEVDVLQMHDDVNIEENVIANIDNLMEAPDDNIGEEVRADIPNLLEGRMPNIVGDIDVAPGAALLVPGLHASFDETLRRFGERLTAIYMSTAHLAIPRVIMREPQEMPGVMVAGHPINEFVRSRASSDPLTSGEISNLVGSGTRPSMHELTRIADVNDLSIAPGEGGVYIAKNFGRYLDDMKNNAHIIPFYTPKGSIKPNDAEIFDNLNLSASYEDRNKFCVNMMELIGASKYKEAADLADGMVRRAISEYLVEHPKHELQNMINRAIASVTTNFENPNILALRNLIVYQFPGLVANGTLTIANALNRLNGMMLSIDKPVSTGVSLYPNMARDLVAIYNKMMNIMDPSMWLQTHPVVIGSVVTMIVSIAFQRSIRGAAGMLIASARSSINSEVFRDVLTIKPTPIEVPVIAEIPDSKELKAMMKSLHEFFIEYL